MEKLPKKFYTDGVKTIKLTENDPIPEGFYPGRTYRVNTWNKGLTKDMDDRVKRNCEKCHETRRKTNNYHSWNKGLTKDNNSSLKVVSEKIQKSRLEHPYTSEQIQRMNENIYKTKKKNNSFNTSKPEEDYYQHLLSTYPEEDIQRQYSDERYPYRCDFHIISEDLFIEINYSWCHGKHPFNPENSEDLRIKDFLLEKSKTSYYYEWALKVWTIKDPEKLKTLRENNLNFKVIYPNDLIIDK